MPPKKQSDIVCLNSTLERQTDFSFLLENNVVENLVSKKEGVEIPIIPGEVLLVSVAIRKNSGFNLLEEEELKGKKIQKAKDLLYGKASIFIVSSKVKSNGLSLK